MPDSRKSLHLRRLRWFALAMLLMGGAVVCADWWSCLPDDVQPSYVGRDRCVTCHVRQAELFAGSDHDRAMDHATPETVLGDFNDATLTHHGITSRMFRRDGRYFVNTEGPDGAMADFEVKYVLGVTPLQNYMVEFDRTPEMPPTEVGRLQVLRVTWDTRNKRWFHLDPPGITERLEPDDMLNWTGVAQRWNNMCADCHSTNLKKNFDVASRKYHTTFSEIDVSCEACHGPGSVHVELANARSLFWDRKRGYGLPNLKGESNDAEINSCAPCHARRRMLTPDARPGDPFFAGYSVTLLEDRVYHADGQILDEDYEFGSFTQSKMYHKNIRCSNCHDVHSTRVKYQDNQLCTSCHAHPAGKYDGPGHHHHQPGGTGALCVNCHMPVTTYMDLDARRDHSLRIPRPGLSVDLGTPNACTGCHLEVDRSVDKLPTEERTGLTQYADWVREAPRRPAVQTELKRLDQWSYDAARRWWGEKADAPNHYAYTLQAARAGKEDAESRLVALAKDTKSPAMARATALEHLGEFPTKTALDAATRALDDPHPAVRAAAVRRFETQVNLLRQALEQGQPPSALASEFRGVTRPLKPLLTDELRWPRLEAARVMSLIPEAIRRDVLYDAEQRALDAALAELLSSLAIDDDRAGGHINRAQYYERLGDDRRAEEAYQQAIAVEPNFTGTRGNLATLIERRVDAGIAAQEAARQRGDQGEATRRGKEIEQLRAQVRQLRREELPLVERDAKALPDDYGLQYRYAMTLYLNERVDDAIGVLERAHQMEPRAENAPYMLALMQQKQKRIGEARRWCALLLKLRPDHADYRALEAQLKRGE